MELLEQDKKNNQDWRNRKNNFQERKKRNDTPAISNNAIDVSKKKKKNRDHNISEVIYYNYNKKVHFANICTKQKNQY